MRIKDKINEIDRFLNEFITAIRRIKPKGL